MRSVRERIERSMCGEFCRYYKPWNGESTRCGADEFLVARAGRDAALLDAVERLRDIRPALPLKTDALLLRTVCTHCVHYPYACSYRNPNRERTAHPCGGLIALDLLLDRKALHAEDLFEIP